MACLFFHVQVYFPLDPCPKSFPDEKKVRVPCKIFPIKVNNNRFHFIIHASSQSAPRNTLDAAWTGSFVRAVSTAFNDSRRISDALRKLMNIRRWSKMRLIENNIGKAPTTFHARYGLAAGFALAFILALLWFNFGSAAYRTSAAPMAGPSILCSTGDGWCRQTLISSVIPGATVTKWTSAQYLLN